MTRTGLRVLSRRNSPTVLTPASAAPVPESARLVPYQES